MAIQQIKVAAALHGGTGPAKLALKQFIGKLRTIVRVNNIRCLVANEGDKATVTVIFEVGEKVPAELPGLYDFLAEKTGTSVKQMRQSRLKNRSIVFARDILAFIIVHRYGFTTWEAAKITGAKSHASIIYSCRKFDSEGMDPQLYKSKYWKEIYRDAKKRYKRTKSREAGQN